MYQKLFINKILKVAFISVFAFLFVTVFAFTDTIKLKDGSEVKGIVVENYVDRIVLSTEYGETQIPENEIHSIKYDLAEQNLVAIADKFMVAGNYDKAYIYYSKAATINPKYTQAVEGVNYLNGYMLRQSLRKKSKSVQWNQTVEDFSQQNKTTNVSKEDILKDSIGIIIQETDQNETVISRVFKGSPAFDAGLKKEDIIAAIWGKFCKYMSLEEIENLLSLPEHLELKLQIFRKLWTTKDMIKKSQLEYKFDGLTLKGITKDTRVYKAGFRDNDLIISIGKKDIKYMDIQEILKLFKNQKQQVVIKRRITLWRK